MNANIKKINCRIDQSNAESLSRIEEQDELLERIESHTHSGMHSSAASVRSLQSIATSLSRIEENLCSVDRSTRKSRRRNSDDRGDRTYLQRPVSMTEEPEYRSRRSSAGSAIGKHSSYTSLSSSPNANGPRGLTKSVTELEWEPWRINERHSPRASDDFWPRPIEDLTPLSYVDKFYEKPILVKDFDEFCRDSNRDVEEPSYNQDNISQDFETSSQKSLDERVNRPSMQQLLSVLYEQLPDTVAEYVSLIRRARVLQNKLDTIHLIHHSSRMCSSSQPGIDTQSKEQTRMQHDLSNVRTLIHATRTRCVLEGHSLFDIDQQLRPPMDNSSHDNFWDRYNVPEINHAKNYYLVGMCKSNSSVYGQWVDRGSRINYWMLHCLCSDDTLAHIHQSILAQPPKNDQVWAHELLSHWFSDGAAVDPPQDDVHSAGAVDSREASQAHLPVSNSGPELDEALFLGTTFLQEDRQLLDIPENQIPDFEDNDLMMTKPHLKHILVNFSLRAHLPDAS